MTRRFNGCEVEIARRPSLLTDDRAPAIPVLFATFTVDIPSVPTMAMSVFVPPISIPVKIRNAPLFGIFCTLGTLCTLWIPDQAVKPSVHITGRLLPDKKRKRLFISFVIFMIHGL